jgi:hypothetical protein
MQTISTHTYQTISGRFSNRGGFFNSSFFGNKHLETYKMAADYNAKNASVNEEEKRQTS